MAGIGRELTRKELEDCGIIDVFYDDAEKTWKLERYWQNAAGRPESMRHLKPHIQKTRHKYGKTMRYSIFAFSVNGKARNFPAHRLLWAWFHGVAPAGMDIDHINGDSLDNRLENLQCITHEENLRKRYGCGNNQFRMR